MGMTQGSSHLKLLGLSLCRLHLHQGINMWWKLLITAPPLRSCKLYLVGTFDKHLQQVNIWKWNSTHPSLPLFPLIIAPQARFVLGMLESRNISIRSSTRSKWIPIKYQLILFDLTIACHWTNWIAQQITMLMMIYSVTLCGTVMLFSYARKRESVSR
jgi:hypothetical protein